MSCDGCVALPDGIMGLSAVCDCGISWSYSPTMFVFGHWFVIYYIVPFLVYNQFSEEESNDCFAQIMSCCHAAVRVQYLCLVVPRIGLYLWLRNFLATLTFFIITFVDSWQFLCTSLIFYFDNFAVWVWPHSSVWPICFILRQMLKKII